MQARHVLTVLAALLSMGQAAAPPGVTLKIEIAGVDTALGGDLLVSLHDTEAHWLDDSKAVQKVKLVPAKTTVTTSFRAVAPGAYAVAVLHDENGNQEMDMSWFPFPSPDEGAAVSNDATGTFGPPSFEDSKFEVGPKDVSISMTMVY